MNIIQIGSNNGKDHVFDFVSKNANKINKLILVDALQECIEETKIQYKDFPFAQFIHCCVSNHNEEFQTFFKPNNQRTNVSSTNRDQLIKHCENDILEIKVPSQHINDIIKMAADSERERESR